MAERLSVRMRGAVSIPQAKEKELIEIKQRIKNNDKG